MQMVRTALIAVGGFGFALSLIYVSCTLLLNEEQWRLTYQMYALGYALLGSAWFALLLRWYRPIHQLLTASSRGFPISQAQRLMVYRSALRFPWRGALAGFIVTFVGYLIGCGVVHWQAGAPVTEVFKTMEALPLVGGLSVTFGYFGAQRVLQPVVTWCSVTLGHIPPVRKISLGTLGTKFFTTSSILAIAMLCLVQPAAYTLGQVVTERHVSEQALDRLRAISDRLTSFHRLEDPARLLLDAKLGRHGYVFAMDAGGRIRTPHPLGYTTLTQERLYNPQRQMQGDSGVWMDRVWQHRVVAFVRISDPPWLAVSISYPSDFHEPLNRFASYSGIAALTTVLVVTMFGRYYTRSITIPLAELTRVAGGIAESADLSELVPVTTDDEVGTVARAFNRMTGRLRASMSDIEGYNSQLERATKNLSAMNQEMEDVLRVVSHDLRAPLINIQGFSKRLRPMIDKALATLGELAAQATQDSAQAKAHGVAQEVQRGTQESLQFIDKSVEKMDLLLVSLLAISRIGRVADPMALHDLDRILDDVLATFHHQLKARSIRVVRRPLPNAVPCRRNEINQALSNLIGNAINYMGATGERLIEIGGIVRDDDIECFVRDTGVRIDPSDQERIFQMFTRLHAVDAPGEGIGLSYVRKIIRSHGGNI